MKIGYGRVSALGQDLEIQRTALRAAGCERIYTDKRTGTNTNRPGLQSALRAAKPGDVLVVTKLDRLARSTIDLLTTARDLSDGRVELVSLSERIDTVTPMGRAMFAMLGVMAALERDWIVERTSAGRKAAQAKGVRFGRPRSLSVEQLVTARELLAGESGHTVTSVAQVLRVHRSTLSRSLAA